MSVPHLTHQGQYVSISVEELVKTKEQLVTGLSNISNALNEFVRSYVQHTNRWVGADTAPAAVQLAGMADLFSAASTAATAPLTAAINNAIPETAPIQADKQSKKEKKPRKQKDPNAPKRPLTAYFLYTQSARPVVRQDYADNDQHPTNQEVQNEILRRWTEMTEEDKNGWKAIYEKNAEKYREDVKRYAESTGRLVSAEDLAAHTAGDEDDAEQEPAAPPQPTAKSRKTAAPKSRKKDSATGAAGAHESASPTAQLAARTNVPFPNPAKPAEAAKPAPKKRKSTRAEEPTTAAATAAAPQKKKRKTLSEKEAEEAAKASAPEASAPADAAKEKPKATRKPRKSKADA